MKILFLFISMSLTIFPGQGRSAKEQNSPGSGDTKNTYVGLKHGPRLPAGLKEVGGGLITDPYKDKVQFGLAHITKGKTNMLWFELGTHHDAEGHAYWEVLDSVTLPTMTRNQVLFYTLCLFNGQPDPEIAAIVQPLKPNSYETKTIKAWRADRRTRRLTEIPIKGVKCEMQGDD